MFSGIIRELGEVVAIQGSEVAKQLEIRSPIFHSSELGDSISVSGVCLTVSKYNSDSAVFDVSSETLRKSSLGNLKPGSKVNLESPITLSTLLHGHIVQGHVDGLGKVKEIKAEGDTYRISIELPDELIRYLVPKASIAVDGVSLTVGEVNKNLFSLYIIPKTWELTTFHLLMPEHLVNIEIDILAKYVERLFQSQSN